MVALNKNTKKTELVKSMKSSKLLIVRIEIKTSEKLPF